MLGLILISREKTAGVMLRLAVIMLSWRHRLLERELTLDEIAAEVKDADIILTEGYKQAGKPTLEIVRAANSTEILSDQDQRFALAADIPLDLGVPRYDLDDAAGIANLIEKKFLRIK